MFCGLLIVALAVGATFGADCPESYKAISSSLCLDTNPNCEAADNSVSEAEKTEIVNYHNELRKAVSVDAGDPSHMIAMVWDDKLAAVAQAWVQSACTMAHDSNSARAIPEYPGVGIGQNAAMASWKRSWTEVVQSWYSEINEFAYGVDNSACGHFTQVVQETGARVGCGRSSDGTNYYEVCNYATGQYDYSTPFAIGTRGSGCTATDGLCSGECAGLICCNGGTLNYDTCTCSCDGIYSGTHCTTVTCKTDPSYCGLPYPSGYPKEFCTMYSNVPSACPNMCGVC